MGSRRYLKRGGATEIGDSIHGYAGEVKRTWSVVCRVRIVPGQRDSGPTGRESDQARTTDDVRHSVRSANDSVPFQYDESDPRVIACPVRPRNHPGSRGTRVVVVTTEKCGDLEVGPDGRRTHEGHSLADHAAFGVQSEP